MHMAAGRNVCESVHVYCFWSGDKIQLERNLAEKTTYTPKRGKEC